MLRVGKGNGGVHADHTADLSGNEALRAYESWKAQTNFSNL